MKNGSLLVAPEARFATTDVDAKHKSKPEETARMDR
jgi:hypothetical protein